MHETSAHLIDRLHRHRKVWRWRRRMSDGGVLFARRIVFAMKTPRASHVSTHKNAADCRDHDENCKRRSTASKRPIFTHDRQPRAPRSTATSPTRRGARWRRPRRPQRRQQRPQPPPRAQPLNRRLWRRSTRRLAAPSSWRWPSKWRRAAASRSFHRSSRRRRHSAAPRCETRAAGLQASKLKRRQAGASSPTVACVRVLDAQLVRRADGVATIAANALLLARRVYARRSGAVDARARRRGRRAERRQSRKLGGAACGGGRAVDEHKRGRLTGNRRPRQDDWRRARRLQRGERKARRRRRAFDARADDMLDCWPLIAGALVGYDDCRHRDARLSAAFGRQC